MGEDHQGHDGSVVVLIPAYNPDAKLLDLLPTLRKRFSRIVLVDDGSTSGRELFAAASPYVEKVLVHPVNRGKGAALRTGFAYLNGSGADVVTADADGQHRVEDIVRIADALATQRDGLVLGVRAFSGPVPLRSRFGNFWTRIFFFLLTGLRVRDTQTGLRGIPAGLIPRVMAIPGDRYEYEMAMLADARNHAARPVQIPIATVYAKGNPTSHFSPVRDAIRIYGSLLQFCLSSVLSFVLDNAVFSLAIWLMASRDTPRRDDILIALVAARLVSSNFNYLYNRFLVFRSRRAAGPHRSYFRYWALVLAIGLFSYAFTSSLSALFDIRGVAITAVKIVVDAGLFLASYMVQRRFVFRRDAVGGPA